MLSRRSVRIKVMQSLFMLRSNDNTTERVAEKHLRTSIQNYFDFYHYVLFTAWQVANYVQKDAEIKAAKFLPTDRDREVNAKLLHNIVVIGLDESEDFQKIVNKAHFRNLSEEHVIQVLYKEFIELEEYKEYLNNPVTDDEDDFKMFKSIIFSIMLPNEVFVEHLGDIFINRDDDGLDVERMLNKSFSKAKRKGDTELLLFKDYDKRVELETFARELFLKTAHNSDYLKEEISGYLTNWDTSRLATVDALLIEMALCEMLYFEEIPLKVTMNEYIDISKEYSTPKSKEFINGVLDKMMKNYKQAGKIVKTGRGLIN